MGAVRGTAVRGRFVRAKDQDKPGVAPQGGGRAGTRMLSPDISMTGFTVFVTKSGIIMLSPRSNFI